jgi:hypothetical protein
MIFFGWQLTVGFFELAIDGWFFEFAIDDRLPRKNDIIVARRAIKIAAMRNSTLEFRRISPPTRLNETTA